MTHVVRLTLHGFRVNIGHSVFAGFVLQDLFGELILFVVFRWVFFVFRGVFEKHFPKALGLEVLLPFVGGRITEDVGDGFAKFLDGNCETVRFVRLGHLDERITNTCVSERRIKQAKAPVPLLCDVAEVLDFGFQTPIPFVLHEKRVFVEKSTAKQS